jgi:hypothetical protein
MLDYQRFKRLYQAMPVKEEEVDALTDLLVQSMDNAADPEFFG